MRYRRGFVSKTPALVCTEEHEMVNINTALLYLILAILAEDHEHSLLSGIFTSFAAMILVTCWMTHRKAVK